MRERGRENIIMNDFSPLSQDLGFINQLGKRIEQQHHGITEDQKPKQLDVPMASQLQLFDAISHLPESPFFPNWASLDVFYTAQKKHVQGVPKEVGNSIFKLKFSAGNSDSGDRSVSDSHTPAPQTTSVVLPSVLEKHFPVTMETPLALLPCPHCLHGITVSMSYVKKVDNPMDQFLTTPDKEVEAGGPTPGPPADIPSEDKGNAPILAEIERQMMVS